MLNGGLEALWIDDAVCNSFFGLLLSATEAEISLCWTATLIIFRDIL